MAKNPWKLSPELTKKISELATDLNAEVDEMRSEFDDKSESWQEGDKGTDVQTWLDELGELADTLDALDTEVTS